MRRRFLILAAPAIVAAPSLMKISPLINALAAPLLTLYGDGVHNDTEALNAFLRGEKVFNKLLGGVVGGDSHLTLHHSGPFLIDDTIKIGTRPTFIAGCSFRMSRDFPSGSPLLHFGEGSAATVTHCNFQTAPRDGRPRHPLFATG